MFVSLHDIALLRAPACAMPPQLDEHLLLRELGRAQIDQVSAGQLAHGRQIPRQRIERRFNHRLRFFQLWKDERLAASTWIAQGGARYIDELALGFPLAADELWIRDIFVAPQMRGMGLFSQMLSALVSQLEPQCASLWSDVDWSNRASMHAHQRCGFIIEARLRAVDFGRRARLRSLPPSWHLPIIELEPTQRLIMWTDALRGRHRSLIA